MDAQYAEHLREGARVAVYMGPHEILGTPPLVTTATVMGRADDERYWLAVDIAQGQQLPQMYRVAEIIGLLMPMAVVEHHPDGSITGTIPLPDPEPACSTCGHVERQHDDGGCLFPKWDKSGGTTCYCAAFTE